MGHKVTFPASRLAAKCHAEAVIALDEATHASKTPTEYTEIARASLLALAQVKMTEAVYWKLCDLNQSNFGRIGDER